MLDVIYNEDCLTGIQKLEDNSIDLVITSPPYNVDLGNNKYNKNPYNLYNDNKEHADYIAWLKELFNICIYPKLKTGGRVCINIGDGKNGAVPTSSDIIQFMKELYIPMTHIIWDKSQVCNRAAWGSFNSPSSPSFPTPFEHILVFCKESNKLQYKGESDLEREEFIQWSIPLWSFTAETKMNEIGHPAMFPVELAKRCLKMFSYKDAVVLDPFMGSGTTAVACKKYDRHYIGFEISPEYCEIANKRLKEVVRQCKLW